MYCEWVYQHKLGMDRQKRQKRKRKKLKRRKRTLSRQYSGRPGAKGASRSAQGGGGARITHTSCFCIEPLLEMSMVKEAGWCFFTAIAAKEILFIGEPKAISHVPNMPKDRRREKVNIWGGCRLTTALLRCFILERLALCGDCCCCCSSMRILCVGFYKWDYYPPAFLLQKSLLNRHRIQPMSQVTTSL